MNILKTIRSTEYPDACKECIGKQHNKHQECLRQKLKEIENARKHLHMRDMIKSFEKRKENTIQRLLIHLKKRYELMEYEDKE